MEQSKLSIERLPGTFLMWLILLNEFLIFAGLIIAAALFRVRETELFSSSLQHVDVPAGIKATVMLLAGGYFAAEFIKYLKQDRRVPASLFLVGAIASGIAFMVHKWEDLGRLSALGFDFAKNDFWLYYWGIMSFHFAHVFVAVGFLIYILFEYLKTKTLTDDNERFFEAGILFWHLCDLIWVMIFPLFYWRA